MKFLVFPGQLILEAGVPQGQGGSQVCWPCGGKDFHREGTGAVDGVSLNSAGCGDCWGFALQKGPWFRGGIGEDALAARVGVLQEETGAGG